MSTEHLNETTVTARSAKVATAAILGAKATTDISGALNALLADFFALYLKTKNSRSTIH